MSDNLRDRTNSGVLFVNNKRGDNAKAPNCKGEGSLTVPAGYITEHWDGTSDLVVPLDLAAWTRQSERAGKYQSLSIKPKGDYRHTAQSSGRGSAPQQQQPEHTDEDLPW
jgi:hypothetical protein